MYLFKNARRNMTRNYGKNILIGLIITVITICTCVGLSIHSAGENLVATHIDSNPLEVSFTLDMNTLRGAADTDKTSFNSLTVEEIKKYADSDFVKDYYYTLESSLASSTINPVEDETKPSTDSNTIVTNESGPMGGGERQNAGSFGDFRITGYSNFAYLSDFETGTKKITSGTMIDGDSDSNDIVISEELASLNSLTIGSEVVFTLPSNTDTTFTYKIVGIYKNTSSDDSENFMSMNALNSSNQIYANLEVVQKITDSTTSDTTRLIRRDGLTAKIYLKNNSDLKAFEKEVKAKGLSSFYTITTNEEQIMATLQPIENISTFSFNFLIVIIVIGVVVLTVINFLNIRDRKYEIGVLRAIGMSKSKVTSQLILETFFVAIVALIIGTSVGTVMSQPITNTMLKNEIEAYKNKSTEVENNYGKGGFDRPSQNMGGPNGTATTNQNQNYIDSLEVKVDGITILELFGVSLLLTICSGIVASSVVNKYNPNKILQNRT